jgi:hypothetical protein
LLRRCTNGGAGKEGPAAGRNAGGAGAVGGIGLGSRWVGREISEIGDTTGWRCVFLTSFFFFCFPFPFFLFALRYVLASLRFFLGLSKSNFVNFDQIFTKIY